MQDNVKCFCPRLHIRFALFCTFSICLLTNRAVAQIDSTDYRKLQMQKALEEILDQANHLEAESLPAYEINQFVVNETISKAGNDFYELFYQNWSWPNRTNDSFAIVIEERPFRSTSTIVKIMVNDFKAFEGFLQPRFDVLETTAKSAVGSVQNYIINYNEIIKQLEQYDQEGTGIY